MYINSQSPHYCGVMLPAVKLIVIKKVLMCQQSVKQHMLQLNEMATGRQFSLKSYFSATPTFEISGTDTSK